MKSKNNEFVAFRELERSIINSGFCTLCGACEASCPVQAIKIEHDKVQHIHNCADDLDLCPICYNICPHTEALLSEALAFVSDAPHYRESLGHYHSIVLAQAANVSVRATGYGGGVVAALLAHGINSGLVDSAVISQASSRMPVKIQPSISLVPDDVLAVADSKLVASAVAQAFGRAVYEHGKVHVAFVGVPCHVLALRKLEAWQHKIMESLNLTIGLFCLWTFSLAHLLEHLLHQYNVAPNEIQRIDLADRYIVQTVHGDLQIPISEARSHIMNRCRTCMDFTSEFADISVGGATPLRDWSIVILRTKKGVEYFDEAVKRGVIRIKSLDDEPEVLRHLTKLASSKEKSALKELKDTKAAGERIPIAIADSVRFLRSRKRFRGNRA